MWTHALPQCTYVGRGTAHKSPFSSHHVPGSQESNSGYQTWCQVPAEPLQKPSSYDYYYYSFSNIHAKFSISSHYSTILNHKGKSPKRAIKLSSSLTLCRSALFLLKETICSAVFSSRSHCWLLHLQWSPHCPQDSLLPFPSWRQSGSSSTSLIAGHICISSCGRRHLLSWPSLSELKIFNFSKSS